MAGNYQDVQKCCCCLKKEFFLRQKGQIGDKFRGHFTERVLHRRKSESKPDPDLNSFKDSFRYKRWFSEMYGCVISTENRSEK